MSGNDTLMIHRTCPLCGKPNSVQVPREVINNLNDGMHIQDAWPAASADDREVVVSGTHGQCYDTAFEEAEQA